MKTLTTMLAALALLAGCASSEFRQSGGGDLPPAHRGKVTILEQLPPPGSYRLLGVVTVRGVELTSDETMYEKLQVLAAEKGANAVVPQSRIKSRPTSEGGEERTLAAYAIYRRR